MSPESVARRIFYPGDKPPGPGFDPSTEPLEIRDARALQSRAGSIAACFHDHGFALLGHSGGGWLPEQLGGDAYRRLYHPEIARLVHTHLYPDRRVETDHVLKPVCRGGSDDAHYADWVHQDFGLTAGDFERNLAGIVSPEAGRAWRSRYESDDILGCAVISFWRTIGMRAPLRHMPLALCDPSSVGMADVVPAAAAADGARYHIGLRYHAGQAWYHYPEMRADELLAFKLFECRKDDLRPERLRSVFHTAFADPAAPADAEPRQSFEHRVIVNLLAG